MNSINRRKGKEVQWRLQAPVARLDYSGHLNEEARDVAVEFQGKDINMYKLNQLKHTFVKNNRNRKYLKEYFNKYANQGKIAIEQLQEIVG